MDDILLETNAYILFQKYGHMYIMLLLFESYRLQILCLYC